MSEIHSLGSVKTFPFFGYFGEGVVWRGYQNYEKKILFEYVNLLTVLSIIFALIIAVEKLPIEELDTNYCEYELEEGVDNEDVEDIFERN